MVLLNPEAAALLWDVIEGHLAVVWPQLDAEARDQLAPIVRAIRPTAVDGSAARQISGSVVPSARELTTSEAAMRLGVKVRRVRQLCESGHLEHRRAGRQLLITESSVDAELDRRDTGAA